jgi:arylsulfatase A-like enzyme
LIDLFPSFCEYAGAPVPADCEGVSQRAVWEGSRPCVRSEVVIEERPFSTDWNQRIIVTDEHKLAYYAGRDYGELYDLSRDPHHVTNLWNDAGSAAIKHRLIERILSHEMNKARPTPSPSDLARLR